jgi:hypothetical protein
MRHLPFNLNLAFSTWSNTIARFALAPLELAPPGQHIGEMLVLRRHH